MIRSLFLVLPGLAALAACGEPPDDAGPLDGAVATIDGGAAVDGAPVSGDAAALLELPPELLALEIRGIAFAADGTVFLWRASEQGSGIDRARPPAYVLERDWMPTTLGLHSELEVRGDSLYFVVQGNLHRASVDAPSVGALSAPLATGLDGMALASAADGTLFYSKVVVFPVPGGGLESFRVFRLPPGGAEQELATNPEGRIGDVAWHGDQLYVVSLHRRTVHAIDLSGTTPSMRAIGERDGALVYGITVDDRGRVYYADSRRLFRFDPATGQNQVLADQGILLAENLALGRGPLRAGDLYLAAFPGVLVRGVATPQ